MLTAKVAIMSDADPFLGRRGPMRATPSPDELRHMLALVGLETDADALEALRRRIGFFQDAMEALDRVDLGMADPATLYHPDDPNT